MKTNSFKKLLLCISIAIIVLVLSATLASAGSGSLLQVTLKSPTGPLRMGDTPNFIGTVTNIGNQPLHGLVVYLSLVSLAQGHEEPVDLEDWSAQKAIRITILDPGATESRNWSMRLIMAGTYGAALTVVNPIEDRPIISNLVHFEVQPKPTLASNRVLSVALGIPLLFLAILGILHLSHLMRKV